MVDVVLAALSGLTLRASVSACFAWKNRSGVPGQRNDTFSDALDPASEQLLAALGAHAALGLRSDERVERVLDRLGSVLLLVRRGEEVRKKGEGGKSQVRGRERERREDERQQLRRALRGRGSATCLLFSSTTTHSRVPARAEEIGRAHV